METKIQTQQVGTDDVVVTNTQIKKRSRSFKVCLNDPRETVDDQNKPVLYGRYNGESPYQAANKALSEIIRQRKKDGEQTDKEIIFYLQESTKGSGKKVHKYSGKRVKLDTPVSYTVKSDKGDQIIKKEYKNSLEKITKKAKKIRQPVVKNVAN